MTCPGKENLRATCPKGKLESNFFFRALNILIMGGRGFITVLCRRSVGFFSRVFLVFLMTAGQIVA